MQTTRLTAAIASVFLLASCMSSGPVFGSGCTADADCLPQFTCEPGIDTDPSSCTLRCSTDEFCRDHFGPQAGCYGGGVCRQACESDSQCTGDTDCVHDLAALCRIRP